MVSTNTKNRIKAGLIKPARFYNSEFAYVGRLEMAFARGALNVAVRRVDESKPTSWEFSAFSQNGEDGVVDHLLSLVDKPNRYFIEIGAADGLENNSSYLAFAKKYSGIMVEGDSGRSQRAREFLQPFNWSVKYLPIMVDPANASEVVNAAQHDDPDFLSLDIDGIDYFVMKALLDFGLRPKVVCVEYNSAFGPDAALTVQYRPAFDYVAHHPSRVYYGVSVKGWQALFRARGYRFVTVESKGVNAFFVDPEAVELPARLEALQFAENATQLRQHGAGCEAQFAQIKRLALMHLDEGNAVGGYAVRFAVGSAARRGALEIPQR